MKYIVRLFYTLLFCTLLIFAYIFGMISFNENKLIVSIYPSELGPSEYEDIPHSFELTNQANFGYIEPKNEYIVIEKDKNENVFRPEIDYTNSKESDVRKLFAAVARSRSLIKMDLTNKEIHYVMRLQARYNEFIMKSQVEQKNEYKRDNIGKKDSNDNPMNETHPDFYDDLELNTKLSDKDLIKRINFIKFLKFEKFKLNQHLKQDRLNSIQYLLNKYHSENNIEKYELPAIWSKYFVNINEFGLYNNTETIADILKSMATSPVSSCSEKERGTQIKLLMQLEDDIKVLIKPMKVPRDYETPPDHFYFSDFERHHAEIASFHVDMLLNFYRTPPTVGRLFDMKSEIWNTADQTLAKTFFYSPAGNTCFTGHCSYYCDTTHATCGKPLNRMEASVQLMLPSKPLVNWFSFSHPYRRSYSKKRSAEWESNDNYCNEQVIQDTEMHSKVFLDLIDLSIFDFIIGNMDRHHYERMVSLGNFTFSLHLDNGRAFGKKYHDEMSILAPLTQCCFIRYSTFNRLKFLYMNKFSQLLDNSLKSDPLYPILTAAHFHAVDRRLGIILNELSSCVKTYTTSKVIIDDGY